MTRPPTKPPPESLPIGETEPTESSASSETVSDLGTGESHGSSRSNGGNAELAHLARRFVAQTVRWHARLVGVAMVTFVLADAPQMAISLALGALLLLANLTMATRTLLRAFQAAGDIPQSPGRALALTLRWPLLALALLGILWYMPARPEGLVLGIGLSLLSSVIAALRLSETNPHHG